MLSQTKAFWKERINFVQNSEIHKRKNRGNVRVDTGHRDYGWCDNPGEKSSKKINITNAAIERKQQVEEKQKERTLIEKAMPTGKITCSKDGKVFLQLSSEDSLNASFRVSKNGVLIVDYFDHGSPKHLEEKGATCVSSFIRPQTP